MKTRTTRYLLDVVALASSVLALSAVLLVDALADDRARAPRNDKYMAECGSCHVAFPAKLLPAQSWHTLMSGLPRHFGTDASLDAATTAQIKSYLEQYAGRKAAPAMSDAPRITDTTWFVREHRKVAEAVWSHPSIKTRANCAACHAQADAGSYREAEIRLPK